VTVLDRPVDALWAPKRAVHGRFARGLALGAALAGLTLAAGGMRLFGAGRWSFWGDELVTYYDARMLRTTSYWNPEGYSSPHEKFIHACPLGFWLLGVWHDWVEPSELTARLPLAVFATLGVVAAVAGVWRWRGPWVGIALAVLLVPWPWGLFHAQNHRPYSIAWFLAVLGFLLVDDGFIRRRWAGLAAGAGCFLLAALSHSTAAMVLPVLAAWIGWGALRSGAQRTAGHALAGTLALAALGLTVVLIRRFGGDFAGGSWWAMSPERCVASLVNNMTWPVVLLALGGAGWTVAARRRDCYWLLLCSAAITGACAVGPLVMSFRADYVFALTLPVHLLAAEALAGIARPAWQRHRLLGAAALATPVLLILPSVASYYVDGNRPDYRSAAAILADRASPGDVVWSDQCVNVRHYLPEPYAQPLPPRPVPATDELLKQGRRVWCVLSYSTGGLAPHRLAWLSERFRWVADVHPLRFDYHQNGVAVFLADTPVAETVAGRRAPCGVGVPGTARKLRPRGDQVGRERWSIAEMLSDRAEARPPAIGN